jgi:RNA polymerase sigma-70 factor, ECF subfamily
METQSFETQAIGHLDALYSLALKLTKNAATADDLVQDTFVKAVRASEQYQAGTNLKAWLCRILTNTFINNYRRGGLERTVFEGPDAEPLAAGWMSNASMRCLRDPERDMLLPVLQDEISSALDAIPEDFRMAVLLCDVEEFSYDECASIMGCPTGTVMSRLYRGRKLLRTSLYEHALNMGIVRESAEAGSVANEKTEKGNITDLSTYRSRKQGVA